MTDFDWRTLYAGKLAPRQSALSRIKRGSRIFVGSACGEPQHLVEGLTEMVQNIQDTEIIHLLTFGIAPFADEKLSRQFRHNTFFIGDNTREAVADGRADYTPMFLSQVPRLFASGRMKLDVALVQISPPDNHGFVSLGISVDITKAAVENADLVIAEVNELMPRTHGYSFVHIDKIDFMVEKNGPLIEYETRPPTMATQGIAKNIAKLVDDGSTIQIGIGTLPQAVIPALKSKRNLGIHTEMCSDWLMELADSGVVTNSEKGFNPGKAICSFAMGTKKFYDFVDNNPMVEFHPSDYVNDPFVIKQNKKMVAINSALEVDLTGQVCADSIGHRFYSGIGGQVDFVRGATRSEGGKAVIALPSTVKGGTVSTIVPRLATGAGVVTTRGAVEWVVTEWGAADLHGRSIRERSMLLIGLAHPKFRTYLLEEAKRLNYVYQDQILPPPGGVYPEEYEIQETISGINLFFRPIKPTDEAMLKELFYSLTDEAVYHRYFAPLKLMPHEKLQRETNVDYETRMTIAAIARTDTGAETLVGLGQYVLDVWADEAEMSFVIRDDYQGKGIGCFLVGYMGRIARERRIKRSTGVLLTENAAMLKTFKKNGYMVDSKPDEGLYYVYLDLMPEDEN